jgi:hypothetical protein
MNEEKDEGDNRITPRKIRLMIYIVMWLETVVLRSQCIAISRFLNVKYSSEFGNATSLGPT